MAQQDVTMNVPVNKSRLVVIDMQEVFRDPASQWYVPDYADAATHLSQLVPHFGGNTVWTRFVRDPEEPGSWGAYFDRWRDCRYGPDSSAWELTEQSAVDGTVISLPTFSKWGEQLKGLTEASEYLVVCGVATDCCVLSTVLGAVDAGKNVVVVADACAGITTEAHQQALEIMDLLSPMVTITETSRLITVATKSAETEDSAYISRGYET